jgi:transposase
MERRKFSREFKLKAGKLVVALGVRFARAARDLDLHVNLPRKWVRERDAEGVGRAEDLLLLNSVFL